MNIIGIGVDIERVDSFREKPLREHQRFYQRIFSSSEIAYCQKFLDPAPHFAARYCAKEAVVKAVRKHVRVTLTDCEVQNAADGAPQIRCRAKKAEVDQFFRKHRAWISLSHTQELAIAFVVFTPAAKKRKAVIHAQ